MYAPQQNPHSGLVPEHQNRTRRYRVSHPGFPAWEGIRWPPYGQCAHASEGALIAVMVAVEVWYALYSEV